jgi:PAS domain S-box-containing protein
VTDLRAHGTLVVRAGRIAEATDGLAALSGRSLAELVGCAPLDLLAPEDRPRAAELAARAARGEVVPRTIELTLLRRDGQRRPVEWHSDREGEDEVVHVRDLGEDAARRALVTALAEIGANLRAERSVEGVHARVRDELARLGAVSALIRGEDGRSRIVWSAAPEAVREEFTALAGARPEGFAGPMSDFARRVLAEGSGFIDDWAVNAPGYLPHADASKARSLVARAGFSRTIAVRIDAPREEGLYLAIASPVLRRDDLPAVRLFGAQVSAALDAARTIASLSRRNAHLAVLNRVAELAGEAADLPTFLERASEVVRPVAGFVGCAVFVVDEPSGDLVCVHLDRTAPPALAPRIRRISLTTPLGDVVRSRVARVTPIPYADANPAVLEALLPFRSMAWVPLVARSRGVGALAAAFATGVEDAQAAVELLSAVGAHFASAIESQGLLGDLRRRVDEQSLLLDVATASAQLKPSLLLEGALRRVCDTLRADAAAAWLREGDRLVLQTCVGLQGTCAGALAELGQGECPPTLAVRRRAPVRGEVGRCPAGAERAPHAPGERCVGLGPSLAVPLAAKGDALGALLVARPAGAPPFQDGEAELVASVGAQLGVVLDSARLLADVRRRLADLEAVHALTLRVFANAPGDLGALLQDACRELQRSLSAQAVAVYLMADGGTTLRAAAYTGIELPVEGQVIALDRESMALAAVRSRTPLQCEDVTQEPRSILHGRADVPPLAMLAIPLVSRRDVRGLVLVADRVGRRFGPGELAVANALAGALGVGVENADLYADARRRVEELSVLNEAGRAIGGSLDLDVVVRQAADAARRITGAPRAFVVRHDPLTGRITYGGGAGVDAAALRGLEGPIPAGTPIDDVVRERRAASVENSAASEAGRTYAARFGGRALVAVPVLLRGEVLGVLVVDDPAGPRAFSGPDVERLTTVADRLAVAAENARLYLETRRRAEELGLLHEVGRSLVHTLELEQVLSGGIRSLARIVDAPAAYLALATPDDTALELRAHFGDTRARTGLRVPSRLPSPTIASLVYQLREPVLVEDAHTDPRVSEEMRERTSARAYLGLPLVVHDRCIGTVVIVETRAPRLFTPAEVERAAAIANQLAVAVENARLYEDLRRSYAVLERAQEQLVRGERLAALGEMAAVVAHEVRNPLGVIFNSLGSLRRLVRPAGDAKMLFEIVQEEADRLNRIVGDLLDFARPSTPEVRPELLGRVAEDAVTVAVQAQAEHIEVLRELDPGLPPVPLDARLVRQAILNVAVNAAQAMPRGGRLTLRTRREGQSAVVELEDTGAGIPDEVRERIFEPFFTTKASGTGLGLAVVRRIVEGHGGQVRVRSAPGEGTTFTLLFPLGAAVENGPAMR